MEKVKKDIDYSKGKIYKIVCDTSGLVYIGSTIESLSKRLTKHRAAYKLYLRGKSNYLTSFDILKNNNYKIILLENCSCNSKEELHRGERKYIESIKCINKNIPGRTNKEYREVNKDEISEYQKKYREVNKEEISEYQKKYREVNKEEILKKIECEFCKCMTTKNNLKKHQRSIKCKNFR